MALTENCCEKTSLISPAASKDEDWVAECLLYLHGNILRVKTELSFKDRIGRIRARTSSFRMRYRVEPGLYAVGQPDEDSPVLVSANYKLSFDELRKELSELNAWILIIDTNGINVWCAAGKGTFGTIEIVNRIRDVGLDKIVKHRRVILPQLGAPGVHAHLIKKATGFSVSFGPIYARDIKEYLRAGFKATQDMRTVRFPLKARLVLTPMELFPALKKFWLPMLIVIIFMGLRPQGILFRELWQYGFPVILISIISLLLGAFLVPLLLPYLPFRSFALKGLLVAAIFFGVSFPWMRQTLHNNLWILAAIYLLFTAFVSFLALNFTGATTFTNISGVKKELRISIPIYISAAVISGILIVVYKLTIWGLL
jgi:hypothetical protein